MGYMNKSCTDSWSTPVLIRRHIEAKYGKISDYDPCPLLTNWTAGIDYDGLLAEWPLCDDGVIFVNPPYSQLKSTKSKIGWIEKCHIESQRGCTIILLIPSRTGTSWFHDIILSNGHGIEFLRGRLKFGDSKTSAPFDSMLITMTGSQTSMTNNEDDE